MPQSVALLYRERGQDIEYFPYVSGFLTHGLRDGYDYLNHGAGVVSFPFGSVWFHSIFFHLFGVAGFMLADFLVATAVFFLLSAFFKEFKIRDFVADTMSLFVVIGVSGKLAGISKSIHLMAGSSSEKIELLAFIAFTVCAGLYIFGKKISPYLLLLAGAGLLFSGAYENWEFFTWRFPRPFVTSVYFLAFLVVTLRMLSLEDIFKKKLLWVLAGASAAFFMQADIYAFFYVGLLFGIMCLCKLSKKTNWVEVGKSLAHFLVPFFILATPFFIQRLNENSGVPRRFGLYIVGHFSPYFKEMSTQDFYFVALLSFSSFYLFRLLKKKSTSPTEYSFFANRQMALSIAYLIAVLWMPLFMIFTGSVILPGHFYDGFRHMTTLIALVLIGMLISKMASEKGQLFPRNTLYALIGMVSLVNIAKDAHKAYSFTDHTRNDFVEYSQFPEYQRNFSQLVKALESQDYSPSMSLATYDMQVTEWWMTFKHGYYFNPESFASALSDDQLENRLIVVNRLLNFNAEGFVDFLNQRMTTIFFSTGLKYQFNKGHTYSSLDDYLPQDRKTYDATSVLSSFNIAIPITERNRLREKFLLLKMPEDKDLPDLIVLQKHPMLDGKSPDGTLYQLTYSNEMFRVWKKK